uniref:Peptidase M23 n=1 Tax=Gongylonema pulchrum TaxID=637853 RepID=A0A183ESV1_9BILA
LRKQLGELKDTVDRHDTRTAENSQRVEVNERRLNGGTTRVKVKRPADLSRLLLSDGMRRSENGTNALQIQSLHWAGREPHKFLIVRFLTSGDKQLFDSWKRFLAKDFTPHGRVIAIRSDLTKMQYLSALRAKELTKRLQGNGVYAIASDTRIGIGAHHAGVS